MYLVCMSDKRKCEILAFYPEWVKEPRCRRYPNCMCGWTDWISTDRDPAMHHPSDPEYNEVCFL